MAEQNLTFTIGSKFSGEGFKKAAAAVQETSKYVKQAASVSAQLAGAMAGMDNSAGKAAAAVAGLMASIASGNPILIAMQVAIQAVNFVINDYKKQAEEAKKAADAFYSSVQKNWKGEYDDLVNEIGRVSSGFERAIDLARQLKEAADAKTMSQAKNDLIAYDIETEKLAAAESDPEKVKRLRATRGVGRAELQGRGAVSAAQAKWDSANLDVATIQVEREQALKGARALRERLTQAQVDFDEISNAYLAKPTDANDKKRQELRKTVDELKKRTEEAEAAAASYDDRIRVAEARRDTEGINLRGAKRQAELDLLKASNKADEDAKAKAAAKGEELPEAIKENTKAVKDASAAIDSMAAAADTAKAAYQGAVAAMMGDASAGKNGQSFSNDGGSWGSASNDAGMHGGTRRFANRSFNSGLRDQYIASRMKGGKAFTAKDWANQAVADALKKGSLTATEEANIRKQAEREYRDFASSADARDIRDDAKKGNGKIGGNLAEAEQAKADWLAKQAAADAAKDGKAKEKAQKAAGKAKERAERYRADTGESPGGKAASDIESNVASIKSAIDSINEKLDKLGLK